MGGLGCNALAATDTTSSRWNKRVQPDVARQLTARNFALPLCGISKVTDCIPLQSQSEGFSTPPLSGFGSSRQIKDELKKEL